MRDDEDKPSLRPVDSPAQSENGSDGGMIARWSRRKREQQRGTQADAAAAASDPPAAQPHSDPQAVVPPVLSDADMPDLEQLDENSDVSGFMSRGVSEPLRQAALRQLFGSAKFNVRDGLDDYDTDFTKFEALGDIVTADMRFEAEQHSQASLEQSDVAERRLPGQIDPEPVRGLVWPAHTPAGRARRTAIDASLALPTTPTSLVTYRSSGRLAVLGPLASVSAALNALKTQLDSNAARTGAQPVLQVTAFIGNAKGTVNGGSDRDGDRDGEVSQYKAMKAAHPGVRTIQTTVQAVSGHLGAFELFAAPDGQRERIAPSILTAHEPFDLVLDLYDPALIELQVPPPGYFSAPDPRTLSAAAAQLPDLNGEFEKPRYFSYQTDLCAHGARGQPGCTRCLDVCPTGAIVSLGDRVEVNPYLCQGGGSCASVCPSGAMGYAYPRREDQLARVRTMLHLFIKETAQRPVLLLHDGDSGLDWLAEHVDALPEHVLPLPVEEVGATGMDTWLSALAYGASAVVLLIHARVPAKVLAALDEQRCYASTLLEGLGFGAGAVVLIDIDQRHDSGELSCAPDAPDVPATPDALAALAAAGAGAVLFEPAVHAPMEDKRETIRLALDHLHRHAPAPVNALILPAGSPFGDLEVDADGCTLCMACASVCPAGAVLAGGGLPQLHFIEQNCLQCGLCREACPETVITLKPRYLFDREARRQRRLLNEDTPFHCVECGRVFGTTKTIERVTQKLSNHWMYKENPAQVRRLSMCDSCRVKDMFETGNGLLDPHNQ